MTSVAASKERTSARRQTEQKRRDKAARAERKRQPDHDTDHDQRHRFAHHQREYILTARAKRHSNADFVGSARDAVRHQPEETDGGEHEREAAKERVRLREDLLLKESPLDLLHLR